MEVFANAKINLGLHVIEKRPDGYHNIETVFYPIGWSDVLHVKPAANPAPGISLSLSGIPVPGDVDDNLLVKAYKLVSADYHVPGVEVHLEKRVPIGAGLGGGSADAAFFLHALNNIFELGLAWGELHHYARQLGADCSFFIANRPVLAEQKGDVYESIALSLAGTHIAVVHPGIHVSTPEAYRGITPRQPARPLEEILLNEPQSRWKNILVNDFETSVFAAHPRIAQLKQQMYDAGAFYAAMSGSGSAVFGLFAQQPELNEAFSDCAMWQGELR
ncbi:MAG: 4-(cytidine 5'-diphospho)-2-C-methyl-D-erythritol kinase [Bacteroidia bacterium]|jgi:4-diphosphocytidyl-2-C-methyl-D-erythritol kinase|nr:4-(cytidine 5'-diphospho)-2-C-methyl-D-erythritol kinase [Bacteroidia bacterium]